MVDNFIDVGVNRFGEIVIIKGGVDGFVGFCLFFCFVIQFQGSYVWLYYWCQVIKQGCCQLVCLLYFFYFLVGKEGNSVVY